MEPVDLFKEKRSDHLGLLGERLSELMNDKNAGLSENERYVLSQRFPFKPNERKATLVKVGEAMKISKERVRQIQESALIKLRQLLSMDALLH
jgi:DNA-directed RNA polymerase sigma subunit (sigma70/sigma32)